MKKKILMISLCNTCRSPIAEAVMNHVLIQANLQNKYDVESASIKNTVNQVLPDSRVFSILNKYGIDYEWRARKIQAEDFKHYDYIFAMDKRNLQDLLDMQSPNNKAQILLLGDFGLTPEDRIIGDPFHLVGEVYFEKVYHQCYAASMAFIAYTILEDYSTTSKCRSVLEEDLVVN